MTDGYVAMVKEELSRLIIADELKHIIRRVLTILGLALIAAIAYQTLIGDFSINNPESVNFSQHPH